MSTLLGVVGLTMMFAALILFVVTFVAEISKKSAAIIAIIGLVLLSLSNFPQDTLFVFLGLLAILVGIVMLIVSLVTKKSIKTPSIILLIGFLAFSNSLSTDIIPSQVNDVTDGEPIEADAASASEKESAKEEAIAKAEEVAKAKDEEEAKAKDEEEAKAKDEEEAKAKDEEEAKAKAEEEAKAKAEEEAKAKAEEEAKAKAEEEAKAKAEEEAKVRAEEEAKTKAEEQAKAKAEEEAKAKAKAKAEEEAVAIAAAKKKEEEKKAEKNKDFIFHNEIALHLLDLTDSINVIKELHTKVDHRYSLLRGEQVQEIFDEKFQNFIVLYTMHDMEEVQQHIPEDLEAMELYDEAIKLGVRGIEEFSLAINAGDSEAYIKAEKTFEEYRIANMAAYKALSKHIKN